MLNKFFKSKKTIAGILIALIAGFWEAESLHICKHNPPAIIEAGAHAH